MFKSLYFKIVLIFLACIVSVIGIFAVIIMTSMTSFFATSFTDSMAEELGDDSELIGELRNVMGDGMFVEEVEDILDANRSVLGIDANRRWYILDMDGDTVLSSDQSNTSPAEITANILTAMSKQRGDRTGGNGGFVDYAVYIGVGGDEYIIYIKDTLSEVSRLNGVILTIILIAVLISALIALIMSLFLSQAITYPIKVLTRETEKIAGGDFSDNIEINSEDELGVLADNFDIMKDSLRDVIVELDDEKRKFETIFSCINDAIFVFNDTGALMNCNEKSVRIFGENCRNGSMTAAKLFDILNIPLRQEGENVVFVDSSAEYAKSSDESYSFSDRSYHGGFYDVTVSSVIYFYEDISKMGIMTIMHDVSQRYELDKMRQEFVANVSHELRTPLTAIRGACESVLEDEEMPADMQRYFINMTVEECDRMMRIVSDLLMLSRFDGRRMQWSIDSFDLSQSIDGIVRMMQSDIESHGHTLTVNTAKGGLSLTGDKARIEQVLINILSNAIKYTPSGGYINIRASSRDDEAIVEISDSGIGIPKEDIEHLFERFYRVEKSRNSSAAGTGLGLAIAKEIVDAHGGKLTVDSVVNHGTTVRLVLPLRCKLEQDRS